ncbi:MAG: AarF/ABC1/UbiB kinase family protein [Rhodospirillaceae bacterium]|jgi:predicted unusual protein kinase regulating ubiquinone biosynthesis (AarF/ABC1/UbiB family)|nr:AarF/ABC1/UbiB kinase family protein [Rhodospirillaceae bacterium]
MADDDRSEENTLGGRVRRYARVGGAVSGLAARLAGQRYLGIELDRDRHAEDLRKALGGLKGPLMKVAQIMSTVPDMLPPEYVEELAELQSNAPSMGWLFVRRRMGSELGPDWQKRFKEFSHEAAAAASLGQVHRAIGPKGEDLACKLQYPDMQSAVEADLRQLKIIFAVYKRYDRAIDPGEIHKEIAARLREELDYAREAAHMRLYANMLAGEDMVHVPKPVPALSTPRLLTMDWMDGKNLLTVKDQSQTRRNAVARNMFQAWYVPFYEYGIIHGDPHLGNYSVRSDGSVNLLDFGCIRVFDPSFVEGVIDLYRSLDTGDRALAVKAYETWGFTNLSNEVLDVLNMWAEFVYAPLLEDRKRPIQEGDGTMYGATVAAKVHRELHRLGGVKPPREFVLMDRAAIGLGSVFMHLSAEVNWHRLFHDLIGDFDVKVLARRQQAALKKAKVPPPQ